MLHHLMDVFLHLDVQLGWLIQAYGGWIYALLFFVILCETGLVVAPILPGDSLLFAAGSFSALGALHLSWIIPLLVAAAVAGDGLNYFFGLLFGARALRHRHGQKLIRQDYIDRTKRFYDRHGAKTIVLARFVPVIRTFAPFVAGVGQMPYRRFFVYNLTGGALWVMLMTGSGYFFGTLPWVQKNFTAIVLAIVVVSILPAVLEVTLESRANKRST